MELKSIKSKFIATIVAIALVVVVLFFVGCDDTNTSVKASDDVFVMVSKNFSYAVVYDRETKVMYAISDASYDQGNFTMLVNADGTPKLYKGE